MQDFNKLRTCLNNIEVRVDDQTQGQEVTEDSICNDVATAPPIFAEIIGSANSHVTLRNVPVFNHFVYKCFSISILKRDKMNKTPVPIEHALR